MKKIVLALVLGVGILISSSCILFFDTNATIWFYNNSSYIVTTALGYYYSSSSSYDEVISYDFSSSGYSSYSQTVSAGTYYPAAIGSGSTWYVDSSYYFDSGYTYDVEYYNSTGYLSDGYFSVYLD